MKKLILLVILSVGLTSILYADYFDDFTDEGICLWIKQRPGSPVYQEQAEKRGLNCSGGNLVGKANSTWTDQVETEYQEIINAQDNTPLKNNCTEIIKKRVISEEYISENRSFSELKEYVIKKGLQNAVQQVTGVEVRDFASLDVSSKNGNESENFSAASTSKSKGMIDSYDLVDQEIVDLGAGKVLSLVIDAYVCVKDNELSKDVLLVGDFLYKNSKFPALRSAAESIFTQASKSFELGYGNPSTSYHDILITGRVEEISASIMVDKKAMEEARKRIQKQRDDAAGSAAFFSILGAVSNNNNNSSAIFNNLSNNLQYSNQQQAPIRIQQINIGVVTVSVSVYAHHKTDNRTYTATAILKEEVSPSLIRGGGSYANSLTIDAIKKASKDLYIQLNSRSSN
jgi:hypothetical protein